MRLAIMPQIKKLIELKKNNIELFQNSERIINDQECHQAQKISNFDLPPQNQQLYKYPENFSLSSSNNIKVYSEGKQIENQNNERG